MMMIFLLAAALAAPASPNVAGKNEDKNVELLRAKDQALLDAIAPGDRKVWDQTLAADAVYVDESGTTIERADFLKQLDPLPAGISGTIKISEYSARVNGDLATVIHTDDEEENYHGQILHARYLTTETWRLEAGAWKLHLVHTYAVLHDPPAVSLSAEDMRQYAGRYTGGGDLVYVIQWDGKQLMGGRQGKELKPLQAELRDVFFAPGQPRIRKIFQRDENGKITGFVDRRESWDLVWKLDANPVR